MKADARRFCEASCQSRLIVRIERLEERGDDRREIFKGHEILVSGLGLRSKAERLTPLFLAHFTVPLSVDTLCIAKKCESDERVRWSPNTVSAQAVKKEVQMLIRQES